MVSGCHVLLPVSNDSRACAPQHQGSNKAKNQVCPCCKGRLVSLHRAKEWNSIPHWSRMTICFFYLASLHFHNTRFGQNNTDGGVLFACDHQGTTAEAESLSHLSGQFALARNTLYIETDAKTPGAEWPSVDQLSRDHGFSSSANVIGEHSSQSHPRCWFILRLAQRHLVDSDCFSSCRGDFFKVKFLPVPVCKNGDAGFRENAMRQSRLHLSVPEAKQQPVCGS